MSDIHDVLVAGRNRLAAGYLVKERLSDGRGGYCARGCLYTGPIVDKPIYVAVEGAENALADALGVKRDLESNDRACVVVDFNNADATTKDDVLALFDAAIAATAPTPDVSFLKDTELERVA